MFYDSLAGEIRSYVVRIGAASADDVHGQGSRRCRGPVPQGVAPPSGRPRTTLKFLAPPVMESLRCAL